MATFYEEMAEVADEVLREFSQGTIVLRRVERAEPDPSTPWVPGAETTKEYRLAGTVRSVDKKFVDGQLVIASDSQAVASTTFHLISVNGSSVAPVETFLEPLPSDTVLVDGVVRTLVGVRRIPDAGTPVAYALILRM